MNYLIVSAKIDYKNKIAELQGVYFQGISSDKVEAGEIAKSACFNSKTYNIYTKISVIRKPYDLLKELDRVSEYFENLVESMNDNYKTLLKKTKKPKKKPIKTNHNQS